MPIFISYSQKDKEFVDALAKNLIDAKHHVWMDRWELSLGDSLTQKIESALTGASAILVIISKNSVESNWCKRELSAGFVRELEESKTIVMPCVIDDCDIPLFIKDKLYADFRRNPDEAFDLVDRSLARISNPLQGRDEKPNFVTDWAVDWKGGPNGRMIVQWVFVDHGHEWPYIILCQCLVACNSIASNNLRGFHEAGNVAPFLRKILDVVIKSIGEEGLSRTISDQFESYVSWNADGENGESFEILYTYRRMGVDNGMDTIVYLDHNLKLAMQQMDDKLFTPQMGG